MQFLFANKTGKNAECVTADSRLQPEPKSFDVKIDGKNCIKMNHACQKSKSIYIICIIRAFGSSIRKPMKMALIRGDRKINIQNVWHCHKLRVLDMKSMGNKLSCV